MGVAAQYPCPIFWATHGCQDDKSSCIVFFDKPVICPSKGVKNTCFTNSLSNLIFPESTLIFLGK